MWGCNVQFVNTQPRGLGLNQIIITASARKTGMIFSSEHFSYLAYDLEYMLGIIVRAPISLGVVNSKFTTVYSGVKLTVQL